MVLLRAYRSQKQTGTAQSYFWPQVTSFEVENSVYVFRMSNYLDLIPHMTNLQQFYNWDYYRPILAKKWPFWSLQMAIFGL